jgi:threonine dehydrogenase-like Zn-dependent dehydrogenase
MRAVIWNGKYDVQVTDVPDPIILNPRDAIIKVTSTAICGSDLHLYDGMIPTMERGDILGHEFMGEVVQLGAAVKNVRLGDRVIVPFTIACGSCEFCRRGMWSLCDNSNPNAAMAEALYGFSASGLFGYSHIFGGYAGGQAEYVRVPFADVGLFKVPESLSDDQVLFLTDILPTAYQAAEQANIQPGDVVAVWGAGPVGQLIVKSAYLLGAERVISIDKVPERLRLARDMGGAQVINFSSVDVVEALKEMTGGRGPDVCIDAVGLEAQGHSVDVIYDRMMLATGMVTDLGHVLRLAIQACRKGGTISVPGVYGGFMDKVNIGAAFGKGLQFRMGQTHVHRYVPLLLDKIAEGEIDPTFIITHKLRLEDAAFGYKLFKENKNECIKVILQP